GGATWPARGLARRLGARGGPGRGGGGCGRGGPRGAGPSPTSSSSRPAGDRMPPAGPPRALGCWMGTRSPLRHASVARGTGARTMLAPRFVAGSWHDRRHDAPLAAARPAHGLPRRAVPARGHAAPARRGHEARGPARQGRDPELLGDLVLAVHARDPEPDPDREGIR